MMKTPLLLVGLMLFAAGAFAGPVLTPLPSSSISGAPGSTIGWGYSLFNDNATEWYLPTSISPPSFANGTPVVLFDFPSVAPLSTMTESYNGIMGLLALHIFANAPIGAQDTGNVVLSGDYFSSDPYTDPNAVDLGGAPSATASITATVTGRTSVPEPATAGLVVVFCLIGLLCRVGRSSRTAHRA